MSQSINITDNKKIESFEINGNELYFDITEFPLQVNSFPRNYSVSSISSYEEYSDLLKQSDFIIIDENVMRIYPIPFEINSFIYTIKINNRNDKYELMKNIVSIVKDYLPFITVKTKSYRYFSRSNNCCFEMNHDEIKQFVLSLIKWPSFSLLTLR